MKAVTSGKDNNCGGFKVIKWKVNPESEVSRHFFVKAHDVSEPTRKKPVGRTLLVINIPTFVHDKNLRKMFGAFGKIGDIFIHQKPTTAIPNTDKLFTPEKDLINGYKVAYIVFNDPKNLKEIISIDTDDIDELIMGDTKSGLKSWIEEYNSQIIDASVLEENVKQFMSEFEKKEVRRKEAEKQAGEVDDEGWTTVTSSGKRAGTKRTELTQDKLKAKKRRMEKSVMNYTPAQIKETKARQLEELKKKFDEDKQKIALLKQQRKFKPF